MLKESEAGPVETSTCTNCGRSLSAGSSTGGLCSVCLMTVALGEDVEPADVLRFEHFEVVKRPDGTALELGRGAMGITYKAYDTNLECHVALKVIHADFLKNELARRRFLREARAAAQMRNPHVASVFHLGRQGENYFYAMEFIDGETVEYIVNKRGPIELGEALEISAQITRALAAVEGQQLVHRDIKPANIIIAHESDGTLVAKLIDFGLAKVVAEAHADATNLSSGGLVGTPGFASPEQFDEKPVDIRSDVYSLGITLWFMVTGKLPFSTATGEIATTPRTAEPPWKQLAGKPGCLVDLLRKMLQSDPDNRPQNANALRDELRACRGALCSPEVRKRRSPFRTVALAASIIPGLLLLLFAGAWIGERHQFPGKMSAVIEPAKTALAPFENKEIDLRKTIAVLPFENLSSDESNAFFADGIHEEILSNLAKIKDLKVISRTSVLTFRRGERNIREIGKQLGAGTILEGSVQRAGNQVRVTAQLIDASHDQHLWAHTYDRDVTDLFTIQSVIAQEIASELQANLSPKERAAIETKPTQDPEAHDAYLQGRALRSREPNEEALRKAAAFFQRAVDLDPSFALAHANLSWVHSMIYWFGWDLSSQRLADAKKAADNALTLKPDLGEAHLALGFYYYRAYRDYDRALQEFAVATSFLPNDSECVEAVGIIERHQGKWDESIASFEKAVRLDPLNIMPLATLAETYTITQRWGEAEHAFDRLLAVAPNAWEQRVQKAILALKMRGDLEPVRNEMAALPAQLQKDPKLMMFQFYYSYFQRDYKKALSIMEAIPKDLVDGDQLMVPKARFVGEMYRLLGDKTRARAEFEKVRVHFEKQIAGQPEHASLHLALGEIYARLDRSHDAIREGLRATTLLPPSRDAVIGPNLQAGLAGIYLLADEREKALDVLDEIVGKPVAPTPAELRLDPLWDSLRNEPRFQKILERGVMHPTQ